MVSQQDAPAVSVIVNCRDGARYLREALDSVFAQTFSDWEVVFWDNLSTDGSAEIARSYGNRVRYFKGGPLRLYAARNRAIAESRGRYIAFLDTDDMWRPAKLELQVPLLDAAPEVGLAYSNAEFFDDAGRCRIRYGTEQSQGDIFRRILARYDLLLPSVMIRRSAYDACSGFDESMEVAGDADLFLRICHRWKASYVHAVTARYREHPASITSGHPEFHIAEADAILRRFRELESDFDIKYGPEIMAFVLQRRKAFIFGTWRRGDAVSARRQAWAYFRAAPAMMALVLASFLPFALVHALRHRNPFSRVDWQRAR